MADSILLPGQSNSLRLDVRENGWTECYFLEGQPVLLGSYSIDKIAERLLGGVDSSERDVSGHLDGKALSWVLSLDEKHCSIYAHKSENFLELFIQDKDAAFLGRIHLSEAQRLEWIEKLKRYSTVN